MGQHRVDGWTSSGGRYQRWPSWRKRRFTSDTGNVRPLDSGMGSEARSQTLWFWILWLQIYGTNRILSILWLLGLHGSTFAALAEAVKDSQLNWKTWYQIPRYYGWGWGSIGTKCAGDWGCIGLTTVAFRDGGSYSSSIDDSGDSDRPHDSEDSAAGVAQQVLLVGRLLSGDLCWVQGLKLRLQGLRPSLEVAAEAKTWPCSPWEQKQGLK